MRILIVGAMDNEIEFLKSKLENIKEEEHCNFTFYIGKLFNKDIILVRSGIGRVMSGLLIGVAKSHYSYDAVINVGVAGGTPETKLGDIIIGENYVYGDVDLSSGGFGYQFGQMAKCPRIFKCNITLNSDFINENCYYGDICTCDSFTTSLDVVNKMRNNYYNDLSIRCFDMESAAFAQACYYLNIPFIAIRAISDVIGTTFQQDDYKKNEIISAKRVNEFLLKIIKYIN